MPTLDTTVLDKENMNVPINSQEADSNQNAVQCADMLDYCDGEKRIALIIHTESGPKHKLRKLFSPLVARSTKHDYANIGTAIQNSEEILQNKKRSRDSEKISIQKKHKRSAKEALAKHVKHSVSNNVIAEDGNVYDSCPEIVEKIQDFLKRDGASKAMFLSHTAVHGNSLVSFLRGEDQDQCGNTTYRRGYVFFEKLRIAEGRPKTLRRLQNENYLPGGFKLKKPRDAALKLQSNREFC